MLTIGSIVYLKKGSRKVMILNRGPIVTMDGKPKFFDYSGCIYPIGLDVNKILYFNTENIDRIIFEGYSDEEEERFIEIYKDWKVTNASKLEKGEVLKEATT